MRLAEGPLAEGLALFALCGLAIAAPLLDLLGRHPGFLVAHPLDGPALAGLVIGLLVLPPAAAWLAVRALARAAPRLARGLHAALLGAFAAAFALPVLRLATGVPTSLLLAVASALAGTVALGLWRHAPVRAFASLLAPLALLPALLFFADAHMLRLLAPPPAPVAPPASGAQLPPVVLVVFDELPTVSLLDAEGGIDARLYPAFAELARQATWFRRAGSVGASTLEAVPAILTGRYPDPPQLATFADHPENLFALLAGSYAMHAHESQTILQRERAGSGAVELRALAADLGVLWLHAILPLGLAARLPDVEHTWRDFAWPDAERLAGRADERTHGRSHQFEAWIAGIESCAQPCLHFLHTLLPHVPWLYTPSGRKYQPFAIPGLRREFWGPESWWVVEAYQRHLLQVAFADRLLGELLARLKRAELFERALVVVTADHGTSFWPNASRRDPDLAREPADILRVPLFVKRPGPSRGAVDDRAVETIDILPAIASEIGIALPWPVDGCSLFDPACPERREQTIFDNGGHRYAFAVDALDGRASLERKLAFFGTRPGDAGIYRVGPYRRWLGRRVEELALAPDAPAAIEIDPGSFRLAQTSPSTWAASRVVGRVATATGAERPTVAIATNGVLRAFVPALPGRGEGLVFAAEIPEHAFDGDLARLAIFLASGRPDAPVLRRASIELREVDLTGVGMDFRPPPRGALE